MKPDRLKHEVLTLLHADPELSLTVAQIANELGLSRKDGKAVADLLRDLAETGEVLVDDLGGYSLGTPCDLVKGPLVVTRGGVGFVANRATGCDVMIPKRELGSALPGDTVQVRVHPPNPRDARRSGRVVQVVERAMRDIVGTLQSSGRFFVVIPLSANYKQTFYVDDPKDARVGDRVVLRFTDWTNPQLNPEGEIIEVIGPADNPSLDTRAVARQYELPGPFDESVLQEAEQVSARLSRPGRREDLRDQYVVTIDPATARDFDDALSLGVDEQGRRVLGVHIADVGHFVRPGTALDREARARGTSVYLVDQVIPMLPEQLSNGVCSLKPDEDRLTFTALLTMSASGTVIGRRFCRSRIRSRFRLSYEEAMAVLEDRPPDGGKRVPEEVRQLLGGLRKLARQLRSARFRRAALDLAIPETQVVLDEQGRMTGVRAATHDESHELIEECMVAANEAVAAELSDRAVPFISRLHEAPDPVKLDELAAALAGLGMEPGDLHVPKNLANLVASLHDHPLRTYAGMMVLKSLKRAEYSADKQGHFGLGKKHYSHFTSPIRRYPDLLLHRQLAILLEERRERQPSLNVLRDIAATSTESEYRAEMASRELLDIKKYRFLQQQIDDRKPVEYDAVIVKVMNFGLFVEVLDLQVTGMIHVSALSEHFVHFDGGRQTLTSPDRTYGVGQRVRVFVAAVNVHDRKLDFGLVQEPGSRKPRSGSRPARGEGRGRPSGERGGRHGGERRPKREASETTPKKKTAQATPAKKASSEATPPKKGAPREEKHPANRPKRDSRQGGRRRR